LFVISNNNFTIYRESLLFPNTLFQLGLNIYLIGIPVIIIGLKIREAADQFAIFKAINDSNAMRNGFELQGKFFKIIKILIITGLVLTAFSIVMMILFISAGVGSLMHRSY